MLQPLGADSKRLPWSWRHFDIRLDEPTSESQSATSHPWSTMLRSTWLDTCSPHTSSAHSSNHDHHRKYIGYSRENQLKDRIIGRNYRVCGRPSLEGKGQIPIGFRLMMLFTHLHPRKRKGPDSFRRTGLPGKPAHREYPLGLPDSSESWVITAKLDLCVETNLALMSG